MSEFVCVGDNTVETRDVSEKTLLNYDDINLVSIPNFNLKFNQTFNNGVGEVTFQANGVRLGSRLTRRFVGNSTHTPRLVSDPVIHATAVAPAANRLIFPQVQFCGSDIKSVIPEAMVAPFMVGNQPNLRQLESSLGAVLRANQNVHRGIGAYINVKKDLVDNTMLYAKVLWYAIAIDSLGVLNQDIAAAPWDDNNRVEYISLANAALVTDTLGAAIRRPGFVFLENEDYFGDADGLILQWIAQSGHRLEVEAGQPLLHMAGVRWDPIPITVLIREAAAPPIGDARAPTSEDLIAWAFRNANARGEFKYLSRGLYWAMENCGIRVRNTGGNANFHAIWPDLGVGNRIFAAPDDYNFLLRILGIKPQQEVEYRADFEAWSTRNQDERIQLAALYTASYSTFLTTSLYNANFDTLAALRWATGEVEPRQYIQAFIRDFFYPDTHSKLDAVIYETACIAFKVYMDVNVHTNLHRFSTWSCRPGAYAQAAHAYSGNNENVPPRKLNPMCIDYWLTTRPIEWGIPGMPTRVNFMADINGRGNNNDVTWSAASGTGQYAQCFAAGLPHMVVPYGTLALNCITSGNNLDEVATISWRMPVTAERDTIFWLPGADAPDGMNYMPALRCFEPATVMTFDHAALQMIAPCITQNDQPAVINRITSWQGQEIDNVGFMRIAIRQLESASPRIAIGPSHACCKTSSLGR